MRFSGQQLLGATTFLLQAIRSTAQTYTSCNPLTQGGCPADSALGKTVNIDFTDGASDSFTATGSLTYDSTSGASFTVAKSGDSPVLMSKWYIMFGKVSVTLKAAHGVGIVSSVVIQSDCLDEIDWEWLGKDGNEAQSNYFGKGNTATYNRGAFHANAGNQDEYMTYTIDWTADEIVWQINGVTVRALKYADAAPGQYPQTPSNIRLGAWSGGDPSNSQGTITWAGGYTDYAAGPYTMNVKSITVQDYSTGSSYEYGGTSGSWQEVKANGGSVYSGSGSLTGGVAPAVTQVSSGGPIAFDSANRSVYPWVADATTLSTATATFTTYPGLPSGWTVTESGKVVPPSSAPYPYLASSSVYVQDLPLASSSLAGYEVATAAAPAITNYGRSNPWHSYAVPSETLPTVVLETMTSVPSQSSSAYSSSTASVTNASAAIISTYSPSTASVTNTSAAVTSTFSTSTRATRSTQPTSQQPTLSRLPQGTLTPSTPAVPVAQTASSASDLSSLYPAALTALSIFTFLYML